MASEKGRESEGKREKNKKEREQLKASCSKVLLISKRPSYSVLSEAFIAKPPLQNTKKTKTNTITGGQIRKKTKNEQKLKGAGKVNSGRDKAILQCCENLQPMKISQPCSFSFAFCFSFLLVFYLQL